MATQLLEAPDASPPDVVHPSGTLVPIQIGKTVIEVDATGWRPEMVDFHRRLWAERWLFDAAADRYARLVRPYRPGSEHPDPIENACALDQAYADATLDPRQTALPKTWDAWSATPWGEEDSATVMLQFAVKIDGYYSPRLRAAAAECVRLVVDAFPQRASKKGLAEALTVVERFAAGQAIAADLEGAYELAHHFEHRAMHTHVWYGAQAVRATAIRPEFYGAGEAVKRAAWAYANAMTAPRYNDHTFYPDSPLAFKGTPPTGWKEARKEICRAMADVVRRHVPAPTRLHLVRA